jgi:hypothetical protein
MPGVTELFTTLPTYATASSWTWDTTGSPNYVATKSYCGPPPTAGKRYLSELGQVSGITMSDTLPGGNEAMSCNLAVPSSFRHEALDPGRRVFATRGGLIIWEGILSEPQPGVNTWQISADGTGTEGNNYKLRWGMPYPGSQPTARSGQGVPSAPSGTLFCDVLPNIWYAQDRGLPWCFDYSDPNVPITWINQADQNSAAPDPASLSVTEYCNEAAAWNGSQNTPMTSMTWRVTRIGDYLWLQWLPVPMSPPTRLLVTTDPAVRTLAGYVNRLWTAFMFQAQGSKKTPVKQLVTSYVPGSESKHGRREEYWDITGAGAMSSAQAQAYSDNVLNRYTATSWSNSFKVPHGQYLTIGGSPVDLACERAGEVVRVVLLDGPYGGEVNPTQAIVFTAGRVQYTEDDDSIEVTPFLSWKNDWSSVLQQLAPKGPVVGT